MSDPAAEVGDRSELLKGIFTLAFACLVGMGIAAAAIGVAPQAAIDPGLRTLTAQSDVRPAPAPLPGFQDCAYATRHLSADDESGVRQVICRD